MAEEVNQLLSDKQTIPTDNLIFSVLGEKEKLWNRIMNYMSDNYTGSSGEWNYYNDGKRWLFKMLWKKKTVFWIGVLEDSFQITFWLPDRAEAVIENSDLPDVIKDEFRNAKKYGATRAVSIVMHDSADVENVFKLIAIKVRLK